MCVEGWEVDFWPLCLVTLAEIRLFIFLLGRCLEAALLTLEVTQGRGGREGRQGA